ncbi:protein kinase domain-containing protein [Salinibaculum rarum]|uniref:protein kinase domain-containing protein n=1 Tax=Salinibaculum rarum TaxID=3058903 RepID=UPI00265FD04D|nr:protein kinase [Salinibaculum sp. KK48]
MTALPELGHRIGGRYELTGEAGEGGFAKAYEAIDTTTGETVAVKIPNYEGSSNDPSVIDEYFQKEATTLQQIHDAGGHPNVMTLYDQGTEGDLDFLVVEFIDGYELDEAIEQTGPLTDTEEVRQAGIDLCDAMSFLHENEIVYRDLKPDNVMISQRNGRPTPVLIDFNTATGFDASGSAADSGTTILGPYKPREVADAGRSDVRQGPWSDVYSIGKILLFLLKGTVPKMDGINPRDFGVDCEPYLADIVERATQGDYEDRYANATSMKHVLTNKDASPPPKATITYLQEDEQFSVYPGDTIGRRFAKGPTPSIAIEDDEEYISTVQVQFDIDSEGKRDRWLLRDRSLNGTYVQTGDGWQRVLSEAGRKRLREKGEDPTDNRGNVPPTTHPLSDGDLVALVHPSYGVTFQFEG